MQLFILKLFLSLSGGLLCAVFFVTFYPPSTSMITPLTQSLSGTSAAEKEVIGFLPFWLIERASDSYKHKITTLSYFSLTINPDGTIQQFVNEQEEEPGWTTLKKERVRNLLGQAKNNGIKTSLVVFNGNEKNINALLSNPIPHAQNLVSDIAPIMKEYGFDDLNVDIESVIEASGSSQQQFTDFVTTVKNGLTTQSLGTLTVDITVLSLFQKQRMNPQELGAIADRVVLMTYDYHYPGSLMSGPVSPLKGAGIERFNDVTLSLNKAFEFIPKEKLLLGIPLYGYEWETLNNAVGSPVIPGTGKTASDNRAEKLLSTCSDCISGRTQFGNEPYVIFPEKNIYHQIFYTDAESIQNRLHLTNTANIRGVALWALGYEGEHTLTPFDRYLLK